MYVKKISRSLISRQHNLNTFLIKVNTIPIRDFSSYFIRNRKYTDFHKHFREWKETIKVAYKSGGLLYYIQHGFPSISPTIKEQSTSLIRLWAHQCECVVAQRVRRSQQMFCLYSKLWEERAFREILNRVRRQLLTHSKNILFCSTGVAVFNWPEKRIPDSDLLEYTSEIDKIHALANKTITCSNCNKRQKIDCKLTEVQYCSCSESKSIQGIQCEKEDWIPFIERPDILVWRKEETPGKYAYKLYGNYKDVSANDFLQVQIDFRYRKKWDKSVLQLKVLESDPNTNSDVIYWEMKWPRFFSNRDYVFNRRYFIDKEKKIIVIVSRGTEHPTCPNVNSSVRVNEYWSYMVIRPYSDMDEPGIEFGLTYFDDPGVKLPDAMTSWVAVSGMPDFMARMRAATRGYKLYMQKAKHKASHPVEMVLKKHEESSIPPPKADTTQTYEEDKEEVIPCENGDVKLSATAADARSELETRVESEDRHEPQIDETPSVNGEGTEVESADSDAPSPYPILSEADSELPTYWRYLQPLYFFY